MRDEAVHGRRRRQSRLVAKAVCAGAASAVLALTTLVVPAHDVAAATPRHVVARTHVRGDRTGSASAKGKSVASTAPGTAAPLVAGLGPPFTVDSETLRLFDPTRSTPARGDVPASSGRVLVTDLFVPAGDSGPLPLVVFAHGWNSDPGVYAPLLMRWAQAGFLVAAPVFPDSTDLYPGSPVSDYADQALDISFVITSLLQSNVVRVDPARIAVAGHSDGGTDVALLALDPAYADARVRAYLSLSSEMPSGVAPFSVAPSATPLLVAVGSADEYGLYPLATQVFEAAQAASKVMVVEQGGDHLGSFVGATPAAADMRDETIRFLELALEHRTPTSATIVAALENPGSPWLTVVPPK